MAPTWGSAVKIDDSPATPGDGGGRSIVRSTAGRIWYAYIVSGTAASAARSDNNGLTWTTEVITTGITAAAVSICLDPSMQPIVVVEGAGTAKVYRREAGVWTLKATIASVDNSVGSQILCADATHFFYVHSNASATGLRTSADLITWSAFTSTTVGVGSGLRTNSACIDSTGKVHAAFSGLAILKYATWSGAGPWSAVETIDSFGSARACGISIVCDFTNTPAVAYWRGGTASNFSGRFGRYSRRTGGTWTAVATIYDSAAEDQGALSLAFIGGVPSVVWSAKGLGANITKGNVQFAEGPFGTWTRTPYEDQAFNDNIPEFPHDVASFLGGSSVISSGNIFAWLSAQLADWDAVSTSAPALTWSDTVPMSSGTNESGAFVVVSPNRQTMSNTENDASSFSAIKVVSRSFATGSLDASAAAPSKVNVFGNGSNDQSVFTVAPRVATVSFGSGENNKSSMNDVGLCGSGEREISSFVAHVDIRQRFGTGSRAASSFAALPNETCETSFVPSPAIADERQVETVELRWPADSPTLFVFVQKPDFDDRRDVPVQHEFGKAMDGSTYLYIRRRKHRLTIPLINLSRKQGLELENFLTKSAGQDVIYRDYRNVLWRGLLTDPRPRTRQEGVERATSIALQFEGAML